MQKQQNISMQTKTHNVEHQRRFPLRKDCSLDSVLNYQFPALVERFQKELGMSVEEADQLFLDMLMFLYLCGAKVERVPLEPTAAIDKAWHAFILFTKEYAEFCQQQFGRFIHHSPYTADETESEMHRAIPASDVAECVFGELSLNWHAPKGDCKSTCRGGCNGQSCRDND
ncbi:MAG: hypothetical protein AB2688_02795 [Candidatus Thiodiazotropha taylori]